MARPFKFRHVNEIAGAFLLFGLALLLVTVVMMGRAQSWFTGTRTILLQLPGAGAMGLRPGADVVILGTAAGSITDIHMDADGAMSARALIRSDFAGFVRADSQAIIKPTAMGVGEPEVEITRGAGPPLKGGQVLQLTARHEMEDTIEQVRAEAVPAIRELRQAMTEYRQLAADLRSPGGNLQQALARANRLAAAAERGEGLAGEVLADPALAAEAARTLPKVNAALDEVQAAVSDLRKATASLPSLSAAVDAQVKMLPAFVEQTRQTLRQIEAVMRDIDQTLPQTARSVNETAEALPGLVVQMQETMRQTQRLVEGIQRSWLIRGSIKPDDATARIRPDEVDASGGGGGARP